MNRFQNYMIAATDLTQRVAPTRQQSQIKPEIEKHIKLRTIIR